MGYPTLSTTILRNCKHHVVGPTCGHVNEGEEGGLKVQDGPDLCAKFQGHPIILTP